MKYHILDKTAAHTGEFIDEEGRNVRLLENAATFETVEAARARAAQLDPAGTWAVVAYDMDPLPEGCALYSPPGLPEAWLVRCAGELWVVPARMNGWAARSPYRGHYPARAGWEEMDPRLAEGCGIPWAAPAEACPSLLAGLNAAQRQGVACIYCGKTHCPLVPVPGLESPESAQLFRCETCLPVGEG